MPNISSPEAGGMTDERSTDECRQKEDIHHLWSITHTCKIPAMPAVCQRKSRLARPPFRRPFSSGPPLPQHEAERWICPTRS